MKILIAVIILGLTASCHNNRIKSETGFSEDTILYPYSPVYTDFFEKGKATNSRMVLEIWKQFESGDVRNLAAYFSDTITLVFPDKFIRGTRDSLLGYFQKRRNEFENIQCYVDAWLPVNVSERKEELVLLWGRQDGSSSGKKRIYRVLHEIWRFDTSGKIRRMEQYYTHPY